MKRGSWARSGSSFVLAFLAMRVVACNLEYLTAETGAVDGGGISAPPGEGGGVVTEAGSDGGGSVEDVDASPFPNASRGIACSGDTCIPEVEICCFDRCIEPRGRCERRTESATACPVDKCLGIVTCDDTADCERAGGQGTICCDAESGFALFLDGATCQRLVDCQGRAKHLVRCDPHGPRPCPGGEKCTQRTVEGGGISYYACEGL